MVTLKDHNPTMAFINITQNSSQFTSAIQKGKELSEKLKVPILVGITTELKRIPNMINLLTHGKHALDVSAVWIRPSENIWSIGIGQAHVLKGRGGNRFRNLRDAHKEIMSNALLDSPSTGAAQSIYFGVSRFDTQSVKSKVWENFEDLQFILPRILISSANNAAHLTMNALVTPETDINSLKDEINSEFSKVSNASTQDAHIVLRKEQSMFSWQRQVNTALSLIKKGNLEKLVLARKLLLRFDNALSLSSVITRLKEAYPSCIIFAHRQGQDTFLGATPERLVSQEKGSVSVTCLAGSAKRGVTPEEDHLFEQALLNGAKDLREHAYVVNAVKKSLSKLCKELTYSETPEILKLESIQHLSTQFNGSLGRNTHVLDLVSSLHPTPAVAGTPTRTALKNIREIERMDRGCYAAPVGYITPSGDGEFGIAIRSALLKKTQALLYAGAGIINGSDAISELEETELKFIAMQSALSGVK